MSNILKTLAAGSASSEPTDEYFNQTTLLLHGDGNQGANNFSNAGPPSYLAFSDNSSNDFPITVNGDAYGSPFSPYSLSDGNWSNYFDGTGDYLTTSSASAFGFGTSGDFSVECFAYITNYTNYITLFSTNVSGTYPWRVGGDASGNLYWHGPSVVELTTTAATANAWHHILITRESGQSRLFIDGILRDTQADTINYGSGTITLEVGNLSVASQTYFGNLSNFRIVNGSVPTNYQTSSTTIGATIFTPPTSALTATSQGATSGDVTLLTCQSNRFKDNSSNGLTFTVNGNPAVKTLNPFNATIDGTTGSGYFDGSGDYLSVGSASDWTFLHDGSSWSLQFWMYNSGTAQDTILATETTSSYNGAWVSINLITTNAVTYRIYHGVGGEFATFTSNAALVQNAWNYVVITFDTTTKTASFYINGSAEGSTANTGWSYSSTAPLNPLLIGTNPANSYPFTGSLSNIKISNVVISSPTTVPTSSLASDANTELLTCQYQGTVRNVGFIDSSPNNFPITRYGNTTQGTFSPFSLADGEWSAYFNSSASTTQLSLAGSSDFDQNGNFTIECWFYPTAASTNQHIWYALKNGSAALMYQTTKKFAIDVPYVGVQVTSTNTFELNAWYHVAIVRNGATTTLYVDGVSEGTTNYNFVANGGTNIAYICYDLNAYVSNLRFVKDAVYTSAFTPPTSPLTVISNTSVLMLQSNRFVDKNTSPKTISILAGTPSIQPFSPFAPSAAYDSSVNGGSGYFDGSGDYLSATGGAATQMGTGAFTWECWCYITSTAAFQCFIDTRPVPTNGSSTGMGFILFTGTLTPIATTTDTILTSSINVTLNAWTHVALTRTSGGTLTIWVNGVSGGTVSNSSNLTDTALFVGGNSSSPHSALVNGYLSNTRITKGTDLYTTTFTPPTAPFTTTVPSGTVGFLVNYTNAGIYDSTAKNNLETVGNAQVDTSVVKYGTGSMKFDGTGDALTIPASPNFAFGTGDFTIEFWAYFNSIDQYDTIYIHGNTNNTVQLFFVSGKLRYNNNSVVNILDTTTTIPTGQWVHLAIVRSSGTATWYLNGTADGTVSDSTNWASFTTNLTIGRDPINGRDINGYIDDLRITKGVARYTTTFTPPDKAFPNQ